MILLFLAVNGDGCVLFLEKIMKISNKLMFAGALACATVMSGSATPCMSLLSSQNASKVFNHLMGKQQVREDLRTHVAKQAQSIANVANQEQTNVANQEQSIDQFKTQYSNICTSILWCILTNTPSLENVESTAKSLLDGRSGGIRDTIRPVIGTRNANLNPLTEAAKEELKKMLVNNIGSANDYIGKLAREQEIDDGKQHIVLFRTLLQKEIERCFPGVSFEEAILTLKKADKPTLEGISIAVIHASPTAHENQALLLETFRALLNGEKAPKV
jgi:hypothetical protein